MATQTPLAAGWPAAGGLEPLLRGAGLPGEEVDAWIGSFPAAHASFQESAGATSRFLRQGRALLERLSPGPRGEPAAPGARGAIERAATAVREAFLGDHAAELYDLLTDGRRRHLRIEALLSAAGREVAGLVPSAEELAAERARALADKRGVELAQGVVLSHFLGLPAQGTHLLEALLRPTPEALDRLPELRERGTVDLGSVRVTRRGRAGILELRNPRFLNAEDTSTLGPLERAVDLILLDPAIEVGVLRGGRVERPGYVNDRTFGSGINLTQLYLGGIDYLFYLVRDLGYVNKIYRGLLGVGGEGARADGSVEKLWVAAVESFAIGGACQLLHVVDHVIATRGARLFLPARKEGIIPGASNLRLPRFVGDRAARQAILSGREWRAGDADAAAICDEVVEPEALEDALSARVAALTDSGLVNAAANRRAMREGAEPLDVFRRYMASYAIDQAECHLSPALVRNLEVHWKAHKRRV